MQMQRDQFNQQMDASIQRRVKDAEKAGIHPLFALGASVGASPTAQIGGGQHTTGSATGSALAGIGKQLALSSLQNQSASAKRDEAEAALIDAQRKKLEQDMQAQGRDGASISTARIGPGNAVQALPPTKDGLTPQVVMGPAKYESPVRSKSQAVGVSAGTIPAFDQVVFPDGQVINTYSSDLEADEIKQADIVYQRGKHKLGQFIQGARDIDYDNYMAQKAALERDRKKRRETANRWLEGKAGSRRRYRQYRR